MLSGKNFTGASTRSEQLFWGSLMVLAAYIIMSSIVYYISGITSVTAIIILFAPILLCFTLWKKTLVPPTAPNVDSWERPKLTSLLGAGLVIIFDSILIATLFVKRTTELLPSPWQALPHWWFRLFFASTFILLLTLSRSKRLFIILLISSLHLFLMFSVAALMYPLGFGFDAFVHRATEEWIRTHGIILPKSPYYIGQYSSVSALATLTRLPIFYIDTYLVPVLAALAIPPAVLLSLRRVWDIPLEKSALAVWLIPTIPFLSLHLTTPHNLVVLLAILTAFALLPVINGLLSTTIPILLALAALATHPLLGAPLCLFVGAGIILHSSYSRRKKIWLAGACLVGIALAAPTLFTINNLRVHHSLPTLQTDNTSNFLQLFAEPYWHYKTAPLRWQALYAWERLIPALVILISGVGCYLAIKKTKQRSLFIYPLTALALIASAWLLRSWIVFPDVVHYEQTDYPLRLLKGAIIFLLPFGMYATACIMNHVAQNKYRLSHISYRLSLTAIAAIILTISLYLSYPQHNPKVRFPGLNVTASDFKAVEWIHDQNVKCLPADTAGQISNVKCLTDINYIVLANQLVSAAALTNYSFAKYFPSPYGPLFYYSLPTGGPLYQDYGRMLYESQKREFMTHAMNLVGVDHAYFVVNSYWANSFNIIAGAKTTADSWQVIDDGKVWIFEYKK